VKNLPYTPRLCRRSKPKPEQQDAARFPRIQFHDCDWRDTVGLKNLQHAAHVRESQVVVTLKPMMEPKENESPHVMGQPEQ
jgi:hypothetical protein